MRYALIFLQNYWLKSGQYAKLAFQYIIDVFPKSNYKELNEAIKRHYSDQDQKIGGTLMTIAQELRQEGIEIGWQGGKEEGLQEGILHEKHAVAKKLLKYGLDPHIICQGTGLSLKELIELKNELESIDLKEADR